MAAATANRDPKRQEGELHAIPGASGYHYYAGTMLAATDAGIVRPATSGAGASGNVLAGVAVDELNLTSGGSTGDLRAWQRGIFEFDAAGTPALADLYAVAYAIDDKTVGTSAAATDVQAGIVVGYTSNKYRIQIDTKIGA